MGTIILIVSFVLPLVIAGLIMFFVFRSERAKLEQGQRQAAELAERVRLASPAEALVITSQVVRMHEGAGEVLIDLMLEIHRAGEPKRTAKTRWEINAASIPSVQPGQAISIKIDAAQPDRIYPIVSWAEYWPHGG